MYNSIFFFSPDPLLGSSERKEEGNRECFSKLVCRHPVHVKRTKKRVIDGHYGDALSATCSCAVNLSKAGLPPAPYVPLDAFALRSPKGRDHPGVASLGDEGTGGLYRSPRKEAAWASS